MEEEESGVVEAEKEIVLLIRSEATHAYKLKILQRYLSVFQKMAESNPQFLRLVKMAEREIQKPDPEAQYA